MSVEHVHVQNVFLKYTYLFSFRSIRYYLLFKGVYSETRSQFVSNIKRVEYILTIDFYQLKSTKEESN